MGYMSQVTWLIIIFIVVLGILGEDEYQDAQRERAHYCRMVELWEQSGGENGHPDYQKQPCQN